VTKNIVVIDNYDSFVYILVQYLGEIGTNPIVFRNDKTTIKEIEDLNPDGILISPGPGTPKEAGISMEVIKHFENTKPIFGVCLGHQCIGEVYDSEIIKAPELMHGKTSTISHSKSGVFQGLETPFTATRYHSLIIKEETLSDSLEITSRSESGLIMGVKHKEFEIEGVQFHPESVLTEHGHTMLRNFVNKC